MKDKYLIKSWWLRNKSLFEVGKLLLFAFFFPLSSPAQIANYVTNGGFEDKYDCDPPYVLDKAKGWNCIGFDTTNFGSFLQSTGCYSNAPVVVGAGFQYPRSGNTFYRSQVFCTYPCTYYASSRIYPKNRLKANLTHGKTYCVTMYVSLEEASFDGISNLGLFFGDGSIDTIKYCFMPLIYLNPQVSNPINNIIMDSVNWVPITGTFVATGNEKYLVTGNFIDDPFVNKMKTRADTSQTWTDYYIDDISCIDIDLPAFACAYTYTYNIPGDSVFLGRQPDIGINDDCMWYKLPNITTPIDTVAGFWAKPVATTTYVVRQEICGNVKWDTVVVSISALGVQYSKFNIQSLELYPIPAQDELQMRWSVAGAEKEFTKGEILNSLGQVLREVDLNYNNRQALVSTKDLANGVYVLNLKSNDSETVSKRFVISR